MTEETPMKNLIALPLLITPALAQDYPLKPITIIVSYAAGGPSDVITRLVGQHMSQTLGQAIVVENVAGASGTIGAGRAAKAANDGYTLLVHHIALAAGATLYKNLPYDTSTAFAPIGLINYGPYVLTTKMDLPVKTLKETLDYIKANTIKVTMAHSGIGTGSNMCNMLLQSALGVRVNEIPYRGSGPALNDVVAGQVDMLCDQTTNVLPQVTAGKIRAHAITSTTRIPQMKDTPTFMESGYPDFELGVWHGMYAPAGTNPAVLTKLTAALEKAVADPTIQKRFDDFGTFTFPEGKRGAQDLKMRLDNDIKKYAKLIKDFGVEGADK
jgi:tripartite-type tricarboxylate transporter receptor subunit TctC